MYIEISPRSVDRFRFFSKLLSSALVILGGGVLAAWIFRLPTILDPLHSLMPPDAAMALLLIGIAIRSEASNTHATKLNYESISYCAAAAVAAGLTLFGSSFEGLAWLGPVVNAPNNLSGLQSGAPLMAPDEAVAVLLLGIGFITYQVSKHRLIQGAAQILLLSGMLYSFFAVVAGIYGARPLIGGGPNIGMDIPFSMSFLCGYVAAICARPGDFLGGFLVSTGSGSAISRWTLAALIVIPVLFGYAHVSAQLRGLYTANLGTAFLIVVLITLSCSVAILLARLLNGFHRKAVVLQDSLIKSEERSNVTLDNLNEPFVVIDSEGLIATWNHHAECTLGWTKDEIIGRSFLDTVVPTMRRATFREHMMRAATQPLNTFRQQLETHLLHESGAEFPVEISVTPIHADDLTQLCLLIRDVSEQKRMSLELSRAHDQAMEASRLKSEFVANMSHEIRTPLNAIVGLSDLLLRRPLEEDVRDFAGTIHDSAESLLTIVNDILDYSKIEAGKLDLEITDLDIVAVLEGAAELVANRAREKGLSLSVYIAPDVPRILRGDPGRIRQVILNLLTNSIKFTEQGEVVAKARLVSSDDKHTTVEFSVTDTGIGISEDALARMFQPFTQADGSVTRKYGGTGLGLSISKRLVELMGGNISADSTLGAGAVFRFTVPLERPLKRTLFSPTKQVFHDVRLLVIDGPTRASEIIQAYASSWGIRCSAAETGEEALHIMRRESAANAPFDLAIVDFQLTHSDALALAHSIRKFEDLNHTKLMLVSSFDDQTLVTDALQAGFSAFLPKPIKQSRLYDCIVNLLTTDADKEVDTSQRLAKVQESLTPLRTNKFIGGKPILVAEDNVTNQKVAMLQLAELGYAAHAVSSGKEAVDASSRVEYALILMDCQMPDMDGFEATRQIRRREALTGQHLPIIAMTAHAMSEDRYKCLSAGMDDYVSKPVKPKQLKAVISRFIRRDDEKQESGQPKSSLEVDEVEEFEGPKGDPVDLSVLQNEFGIEEAQEIFKTFVTTTGPLLATISRAARERDAKQMKDIVHQLKGSADSIGAFELAQIARETEKAIPDDDWNQLREFASLLLASFDRLQIFIDNQFPTKKRELNNTT